MTAGRTDTMRPGRRLSLATLALLLVGGAMAGCDAAEKVTGPDPDEAADALAEALVSGDFGAVAFTEGTAEDVAAEYAKAVEGMGETTPAVTATGTDESGEDGAIATLSWTWTLAGEEWSYTTQAPMTEAGARADWNFRLRVPAWGRSASIVRVAPAASGSASRHPGGSAPSASPAAVEARRASRGSKPSIGASAGAVERPRLSLPS